MEEPHNQHVQCRELLMGMISVAKKVWAEFRKEHPMEGKEKERENWSN